MRQRLDDPIFQFTNTNVSGASVATVLTNTTLTNASAWGWANSAGATQLFGVINTLAAQLNLIGIIRSS